MNKVCIANPIYDVVFKYLMEDERIAKTILSALLKKEVVSVEMRRNEYSNARQTAISIFRIDFGARVREDDGTERLILIELQKTWLATETLRFRQYLGVHYSNPENLITEENGVQAYAYPIVAVYLLGHRIGDIDEPVVYVKRQYLDYEGNAVSGTTPNPFIESLTHDSIIVQIPLLQGRTRHNRLERILDVFDQSRKGRTLQLLEIDEDLYQDDTDLTHIIARLVKAAANPDMRQQMNVEDEILSEVEKRDTLIMQKDQKIEEQDQKIEQQGQKIEEQRGLLAEKDQALINTAKVLKSMGKTYEEIAAITTLPVESLKELL